MSAEQPTRHLEHLRHRTLRELAYQHDTGRLARDEYDRRTTLARRATSPHDLRPLVADLVDAAAGHDDAPPVPAAPARPPVPAARPAPARASAGEAETVLAILSRADRTGRWQPPTTVNALAFMGGVRLDFREAELPPGTTRVHAYALMGGVSIVVPPDVAVRVRGIGLMGGFGPSRHVPSRPDAPSIVIDGLAVMGGVEVKVRDPDAGPAAD